MLKFFSTITFSFCLLVILSTTSAQVVPHGFGLDKGIQILVFIDSQCETCQAIHQDLQGLAVTYIGSDFILPYNPYQADTTNQLIARTFRVPSIPTIYILVDGHTVQAFEGGADRATIEEILGSLENNDLSLDVTYKITPGQTVSGKFENYTGLVVFYRESCELCIQEKPLISELCQNSQLTLTVISTKEDEPLPDNCQGEYNRQLALDWGLPGVPAAIYINNGTITWIDSGYREDLSEILEDLVKTEGATQ
jgi:thiol-disulfide isomerase/thioredoxin